MAREAGLTMPPARLFETARGERFFGVERFDRDEGGWELAPAYDLVFAVGPDGEHNMTVAGEGRAPARRHLLQLAAPPGISESDAESILDEVASAAARWRVQARETGVSPKSTKVVEKAVGECLARL
jgi:serine/threonine-protein kinase HipA